MPHFVKPSQIARNATAPRERHRDAALDFRRSDESRPTPIGPGSGRDVPVDRLIRGSEVETQSGEVGSEPADGGGVAPKTERVEPGVGIVAVQDATLRRLTSTTGPSTPLQRPRRPPSHSCTRRCATSPTSICAGSATTSPPPIALHPPHRPLPLRAVGYSRDNAAAGAQKPDHYLGAGLPGVLGDLRERFGWAASAWWPSGGWSRMPTWPWSRGAGPTTCWPPASTATPPAPRPGGLLPTRRRVDPGARGPLPPAT